MPAHDHYELLARIDTPDLFLRPMAREDAEQVLAWRSDPAIAALFLRTPPTLDDHLGWFDGPRTDRVDYVFARKSDGAPIGTVNFKDIDPIAATAETGTLVGDRTSRGKGFGLQVKVAWMLYGFAYLELESVLVVIRADNDRMIKLNTGIGYVSTGNVVLANAFGTPMEFVRMRLGAEAALSHDVYRRFDHHGFLERIQARRPS